MRTDNPMVKQQLQQTVSEAIVLTPNFAAPQLPARVRQLRNFLVVGGPDIQPLRLLGNSYSRNSEQKLFYGIGLDESCKHVQVT